jgi:hypothetical protein
MKQFAGFLVSAVVLSGSGCVSLDMNFFAPKPPPPAVKEVPPPPPAVTAAQVTEKNAAEMMDALRDELDYAAKESQAPPATPAGKKL